MMYLVDNLKKIIPVLIALILFGCSHLSSGSKINGQRPKLVEKGIVSHPTEIILSGLLLEVKLNRLLL